VSLIAAQGVCISSAETHFTFGGGALRIPIFILLVAFFLLVVASACIALAVTALAICRGMRGRRWPCLFTLVPGGAGVPVAIVLWREWAQNLTPYLSQKAVLMADLAWSTIGYAWLAGTVFVAGELHHLIRSRGRRRRTGRCP